MATRRGWSRGWVLVFIGAAAPSAFAVESALRALLFPPELEALRVELQPTSTTIAWVLLALCVPAVPLGLACKRWIERRSLARLADPSAKQREGADMEALLLASSIPQLPALLAVVAAMGGSRLTPVVASLVVSTLGVLAQGLVTRSSRSRMLA